LGDYYRNKGMKNVAELRDDLADVFAELKAGTIKHEKASQMTNCAGKIIGTLRVEMEYADQRNTKPDIEFMKP
jgi:hypothetical protein